MTEVRSDEGSDAVIFDVQRLALDDGPGIRTNVFFKGCPLRCEWCHNPESIPAKTQLSYTKSLCVGCALCGDVCEYDVHRFVRTETGVVHHVAFEKCVGCGECLEVCCYDALDLAGTRYTVDELVRLIEVDRPYYELGEGGGVTLTGGEPMMQWRFIRNLIRKLKGIHVTVETSGQAAPDAFREIASDVDLFLFDIKALSPEKHRQYCGADNKVILANLDYLVSSGSTVALRLPLIPGINDDEAHLRGIAGLMDRYPRIPYAQVMPYHNLGESKTERFGIAATMADIPSADMDQQLEWRDKLISLGIRPDRLR